MAVVSSRQGGQEPPPRRPPLLSPGEGALMALVEALEAGKPLVWNGDVLLAFTCDVPDSELWRSQAEMVLDQDDFKALKNFAGVRGRSLADTEAETHAEGKAMADPPGRVVMDPFQGLHPTPHARELHQRFQRGYLRRMFHDLRITEDELRLELEIVDAGGQSNLAPIPGDETVRIEKGGSSPFDMPEMVELDNGPSWAAIVATGLVGLFIMFVLILFIGL